MTGSKQCTKCKKYKMLYDFYFVQYHKGEKLYPTPNCKECHGKFSAKNTKQDRLKVNKRRAKYYAKNPWARVRDAIVSRCTGNWRFLG